MAERKAPRQSDEDIPGLPPLDDLPEYIGTPGILPEPPDGKAWLTDEDGNSYLVDREAIESPSTYINQVKGEAQLDATMCIFCTRFQARPGQPEACDAFPGGIPEEILDMRFDHRWPHPDDNGLLYEPDEDAPEELRRSPGTGPAY